MLSIAGISIALFISALLLVKKNKSGSDVFLLLWMLLNAIHLGFYYLSSTENLYVYPQLLGFQLPLPLLHGVFLYLYVSHVTNQAPSKKWYPLLHLIPTIIAYIYLIPFFMLSSNEKIEIFKIEGGEKYALFQIVLQIAVFLSGIIYVVWSIFLLRKHKKNIRSQFSDIEEISLSWLQFLIYGLGLIWCLVIVTQQDAVIFFGVAIFVILVGFFGVQQKNIFNQTNLAYKKSIDGLATKEAFEAPKEKYQSSGLSDDLAEDQYQKLNQLMNQKEVYKNSTLSLSELASELEIHPNYLSQIINEKAGKTFYDYVNSYRVAEFKNLISQSKNQQFTLMAIAYECGFNSKSSFNRYFKKITGSTPSQYVKELRQ